MPSTPPHHPARSGALRRLAAWWVVLLVLACAHLAPALVGEAEAAKSSSKSGSKSGKKKSTKKSTKKKKGGPAKAAPVIRPVQRDVSGPQSVPSDDDDEEVELDGDSEEDLDGEDAGSDDPVSELEAIERELLAQPYEAEADVRVPEPVEPAPLTKPMWVDHKVIPGDTVEEVAKRYGVTAANVARWNGIKADAPIPFKKKSLRVQTTTPVPPREKLEHTVKRGDTWDSVAKALGVDVPTLRRFNPRIGDKLDPKKKQKLVAWRDLEIAPSVALSTKLGQLRVRGGGVSIGKPSRGKLVRGVELPERPDLYTRRKPEEEFGSTHTIAQMLAAFTRFRHDSGYKGQVVIGGISRPRGGRFRPHKSHQSGRDVDIRLPLLPGSQDKKHPTSADVDWRATWNLMRAFLDTGEVEYIFLDYRLQKKIYKAAREAGARREQLDLWLQWPAKPRTNKGVIRHVEGHRAHMHVRIRCGPQEKHCYSQR